MRVVTGYMQEMREGKTLTSINFDIVSSCTCCVVFPFPPLSGTDGATGFRASACGLFACLVVDRDRECGLGYDGSDDDDGDCRESSGCAIDFDH